MLALLICFNLGTRKRCMAHHGAHTPMSEGSLWEEGWARGAETLGVGVPKGCPALPRSFTVTCATWAGPPRFPLLTSCHSPEVDVGEEEQQHQRGHDQPAVDKLHRETGRVTTPWPRVSQALRFQDRGPSLEILLHQAPTRLCWEY